MKRIFCLVAILAALPLGMKAVAGPIGAGDILIFRVGDGSSPITNRGQAVFLDEYTTNTIWANRLGNLNRLQVQSIEMPTNWYGANAPLIVVGDSEAEGIMNLSTDGRFLVFTGFGATLTNNNNVLTYQNTNDSLSDLSSTSAVPRVVGLVDGYGHIFTTTAITNVYENDKEPRAAASVDGTNIWSIDGSIDAGSPHGGGVHYETRGSLVSTQVLYNTLSTYRSAGIYNNALYVDNDQNFLGATNTSATVNPLGGSLPTSSVASNFEAVPGVYGSGIGSAYGFVMFNLKGGASNDTIYVCDSTTNFPGLPLNNGGAVLKFCYEGSSWVNCGAIGAQGATSVAGFLTYSNSNPNIPIVTLYITQGGGANGSQQNNLYPYTDFTGFGGNPRTNPVNCAVCNQDSTYPNDADANIITLNPVSGVGNGALLNTRGVAVAPVGGDYPNETGVWFTAYTTNGPGRISVGPPYGINVNGPTGGPFFGTNTYSIANFGTNSVGSVTALNVPGFLTPMNFPSSLAPLGNAVFQYVVNSGANSLTASTNGLITIVGTSGSGSPSTRIGSTNFISYNIICNSFILQPTNELDAVGEPGSYASFNGTNYVYTLTNVTPSALCFSASVSNSADNWITVSPTNGMCPPNDGTVNVTVSINTNVANLAISSYTDYIMFSNCNANLLIDYREIRTQVGFGIFDDFTTYPLGAIDEIPGDGWIGNPADQPQVYIANYGGSNQWVVPGGCPGTGAEQPESYLAATPLTNPVGVAVLGMAITITNASPSPNYTFRLGCPDIDRDCAGTVNHAGGGYVWSTELDQEQTTPTIGTQVYNYNQQYQVFLVSDNAGYGAYVLVNPGTPDLTSATGTPANVAVFSSGGSQAYTYGQSTGVESVIVGQYSSCPGEVQQGYMITRLAASTNYADVYNWLNTPACTTPTAGFSSAQFVSNGVPPLTVYFTDTSSGTPTSWNWTFGDNVGTSSIENPSYTYSIGGSYLVTQIVANACGSSTNVQTITVQDPFAYWESAAVYNLTGTLTGANASYTGDGMSNTNKFLAGFSPVNAAAYLHIISVAKTGGGSNVTVTYLGASGDNTYTPSVASRTNILEYSAGAGNGSYANTFLPTGQTNILSGGSGLGTVTNMTDSGGATNVPSRYYRVRVLLP